MGLLKRLLTFKSAGRAQVPPSVPSATGFPRGFWQRGSTYDYETEAGQRYDNSVVLTCINWMARAMMEAPMCAKQGDRVIESQAVKAWIEAGEPFFGNRAMVGAIALSLSVSGNSYLVPRYANNGQPGGWWYLPHDRVFPETSSDDVRIGVAISHYAYRPQGQGTEYRIPPEEIIHFRIGLDPRDMRLGLSPLAATLRELCVDNEAATYTAATLRNMGIPGVIFIPKVDAKEITKEQRQSMKDRWREFTRDLRGLPFDMPLPVDIESPSFTPEQIGIEGLRAVPVQRICAALGLDPLAVGLPSESKTYSNYAEAREAAWEQCILPMLGTIADQYQRQAGPMFGGFSETISFDTSNVRALQEDREKLHGRVREDFKANLLQRGEARGKLGEVTDLDDKSYFSDLIQPRTAVKQIDAALIAKVQADRKRLTDVLGPQ